MVDTAQVLKAAAPRIGGIGGAFYFVPETLAVGREHGLDGYRFYFLGRGGVLGDVEAQVVESAFGYFHPALVAKMWNTGRERTSLTPSEASRVYLRCAHDYGRAHFGDLPGLAEFCEAASAVNDASSSAGIPLYAAIAAEPMPDDVPARAMHLTTVLRELRGSAHLIAILATEGIDPATAHGIRRPGYWTTFGYSEDTVPAGTDEQRAALAAAEELTDRMVAPAFDALDAAGRTALVDGLVAMADALPARQGPTK